jgi:hypothetical protein
MEGLHNTPQLQPLNISVANPEPEPLSAPLRRPVAGRRLSRTRRDSQARMMLPQDYSESSPQCADPRPRRRRCSLTETYRRSETLGVRLSH